MAASTITLEVTAPSGLQLGQTLDAEVLALLRRTGLSGSAEFAEDGALLVTMKGVEEAEARYIWSILEQAGHQIGIVVPDA